MTELPIGTIVKYEDELYKITFSWNHGGNRIYYDLEAIEPVMKGVDYHRIAYSVFHSEIEEVK